MFGYFFFYLLDYVSKCGHREKIKIEPEPKSCKIIELLRSIISVECMLIRMEVNSGPKHQLLHYDYHSNGFYLYFSASNKSDSFFFFFLIFEN